MGTGFVFILGNPNQRTLTAGENRMNVFSSWSRKVYDSRFHWHATEHCSIFTKLINSLIRLRFLELCGG
jgi:hypothetical protein